MLKSLDKSEETIEKTVGVGKLYILHEAPQDQPPLKAQEKVRKVYPQTITATDLALKEIESVQFIVEKILPTGIAILAGLPKLGKSILTIQTLLAVGHGRKLFGCLNTEKSEALLISLEDGEGTLQNRILKMFQKYPASDSVHVVTEWEGNFEEKLASLRQFLSDHKNIKLLVIDTLVHFCGQSKQGTYYNDYNNLKKLRKISTDYNICILALHHVTKTQQKDWLSGLYGSHGMSAGADSILFLDRARDSEFAKLRFAVRDNESGSLNLKFDKENLVWEETGYSHELQNQPERRELYDILIAAKKPLTLDEITSMSGKKKITRIKCSRAWLIWA